MNKTPDISQLDFVALAAWDQECTRQRFLTSAWTLKGFRWRRAATRADQEYTNRLLAHTSATPGLCDQCQTRAVTTHVAYQPKDAPRFAHYCGLCAPGMPTGWLVVATFGKSRADSRAP